jgi:hypothetical protein
LQPARNVLGNGRTGPAEGGPGRTQEEAHSKQRREKKYTGFAEALLESEALGVVAEALSC